MLELFLYYWQVFLILSLIIFIPIFYFTWQGAPFVKTTDEDLSLMLEMVHGKKGRKMVDIGSGDGRIVIAFAKAGFEAEGYEIDPRLVRRSRQRIKELKLSGRVNIYSKSFWSADFSSYDTVTVYGIHHIMGRLEKKLKEELKPGSVVLSNYYKFPNWKEVSREGRIGKYVV